jgi:hypothetical protein
MIGMTDATNYLYLNDVEDRASSAEHIHLDLDPSSGKLALHHSCDVFVAVVREIGELQLIYDSGLINGTRDVSECVDVQEGDFVLAVLPSQIDKRVDPESLSRIMSLTAGRKTQPFQGWLHNMIYDLRSRITNTVVLVPICRKPMIVPDAKSFDSYNWSCYALSFGDYARFVPMNIQEHSLLKYLLSSMHMLDEDDHVRIALRKPSFAPRKPVKPSKRKVSPRSLQFDDADETE